MEKKNVQQPHPHDPVWLDVTMPSVRMPTLSSAAQYLWQYLIRRAKAHPLPLEFGSRVHVAMMANMKFRLAMDALSELETAAVVRASSEPLTQEEVPGMAPEASPLKATVTPEEGLA